MRVSSKVICVALLASVLAGCTTNYSHPIQAEPIKTQQERNFQTAWQASMDTLRKYYFTIDRADRRSGVIVTRPMTGQYCLEFWRRDAVSKYDMAEGSIQTVYRTATVTIRPTQAGSDSYKASVDVTTVRSDRLTRQVNSVFDAFAMFAMNGNIISNESMIVDMTAAGQEKVAERRLGLVPLGNDKALADRLTSEINSRSYQVSATK